VRGEGEVSGIRQQRQQAQQAQAEMAATSQMAEAAGNAAPVLRAVDETQVDLEQILGAAQ